MICRSVRQRAWAISILLLLNTNIVRTGAWRGGDRPAGEIPIEVELLLQLQRLVSRVRLPTAFPLCRREGSVRAEGSAANDMKLVFFATKHIFLGVGGSE